MSSLENKQLLVAFHGLPGSGKDTAANRLIEAGGWSKVSFAAPVKRGLSAMLNIPMEDIENPILKNQADYKFGRSIRYMLQALGTEWGRELIADDLWIQIAKESIDHQFKQGMNVVNTDLRFDNECVAMKAMGGYVVHIIRPRNVNGDISLKTGLHEHASNAAIPDEFIDYTIRNDGSLEEFQTVVTEIINDIKRKSGLL